jgi:hypothetical protein
MPTLKISHHERRPRVGHRHVRSRLLERVVGPVPRLLDPRHKRVVLASVVTIIGNVKQANEVLLVGDHSTFVVLVGHAPT